MRHWLRNGTTVAALVAGLVVSGASIAALLGIGLQITTTPIVQFDQGTTVIAGGTFTASVADGFMAIATGAGGSLVTDNSLTINLSVGAACDLVGGVPGDDLVLSGGIFGGVTELLLTAEVAEFGFTEQTGTLQEFDFRFIVTGGSLAPDFLNEDLGVVVTSLNSNFAADFSVNSAGLAKGKLGPIPPIQDAEGCTPGYWKQKHHFDSWDLTPYASTDTVSSAFGALDASVNSLSLKDALKLKGGGLNALIRHAVAALLNASHPDVNSAAFPSAADVIAATQAAVASGDYEPTKDAFEEANEEGCPIN